MRIWSVGSSSQGGVCTFCTRTACWWATVSSATSRSLARENQQLSVPLSECLAPSLISHERADPSTTSAGFGFQTDVSSYFLQFLLFGPQTFSTGRQSAPWLCFEALHKVEGRGSWSLLRNLAANEPCGSFCGLCRHSCVLIDCTLSDKTFIKRF